MKRAIVLLSGGLDSTVSIYNAIAEGYNVKALTVHYGQLHSVEIESAKRTAKILNIEHVILPISLPWKGSALIDEKMQIPQGRDCEKNEEIPSTYVPARNTIFLSFALSWAEVAGVEVVVIGANQVDYSGYPDCREEYFSRVQEVFKYGTKKGVEGSVIEIVTPLLMLNKKEIILLGNRLCVPFENTWSCYKGDCMPCGKCDSCLIRKKGFEDANISDPLMRQEKNK